METLNRLAWVLSGAVGAVTLCLGLLTWLEIISRRREEPGAPASSFDVGGAIMLSFLGLACLWMAYLAFSWTP